MGGIRYEMLRKKNGVDERRFLVLYDLRKYYTTIVCYTLSSMRSRGCDDMAEIWMVAVSMIGLLVCLVCAYGAAYLIMEILKLVKG